MPFCLKMKTIFKAENARRGALTKLITFCSSSGLTAPSKLPSTSIMAPRFGGALRMAAKIRTTS